MNLSNDNTPPDPDEPQGSGLSAVPHPDETTDATARVSVPAPEGAGADDDAFEEFGGGGDPDDGDEHPDDLAAEAAEAAGAEPEPPTPTAGAEGEDAPFGDEDPDGLEGARLDEYVQNAAPVALTPEQERAKAREKRQAKLFELGSVDGDPDVTSQTWIKDDDIIERMVVLKGGETGLKTGPLSRDENVRLFVTAELQGRKELVVRDKDTREDLGEIKETFILRPTRTESIEGALRDRSTGLLDLALRIAAEEGLLPRVAA